REIAQFIATEIQVVHGPHERHHHAGRGRTVQADEPALVDHAHLGIEARQAAYRNAAAQPILPGSTPSSFMSTSAQWYITNAGAIPKLTKSASESYCTPNSLLVPVSRATRPSTPSNTPATNTATQACSNCPLAAARIA